MTRTHPPGLADPLTSLPSHHCTRGAFTVTFTVALKVGRDRDSEYRAIAGQEAGTSSRICVGQRSNELDVCVNRTHSSGSRHKVATADPRFAPEIHAVSLGPAADNH
jgi:hypothetical protein